MVNNPPKQYLCVTLFGEDAPGILHQLFEVIEQNGCSITASRMASLGMQATVSLLIGGTWDALAKLEPNLQNLANQLKLKLLSNRTERKDFTEQQYFTYTVEIITLERPGVLHTISSFLSEAGINIIEVNSFSYKNQTGAELANAVLRVHVPVDAQVGDIREKLMLVCDAINVDAVFEPERL